MLLWLLMVNQYVIFVVDNSYNYEMFYFFHFAPNYSNFCLENRDSCRGGSTTTVAFRLLKRKFCLVFSNKILSIYAVYLHYWNKTYIC